MKGGKENMSTELVSTGTSTEKTLSLKTLAMYSIGFAPSAVLCFNAFYIYYMYFMTDIAKIPAIIAGGISLFAIAWDAVSDPIIAYKSDNCRWKIGRRVPFMTIGVIVMTLSLVFTFTVFDLSVTGKSIYFVIWTLLFWTGATMWDIPHNALGAELTSKQSEREKLRIGTTIVDGIGLMFVVYIIPNLSDYLIKSTGNEPKGWQLTMVVISLLALIIGLSTCITLYKEEPKIDWEKRDAANNGAAKKKVSQTIKELFQLKPYKFLCITVVAVNIGSVCMQSAIVYFMTYLSGFTPAQQSMALVCHYATHLIFGILIGSFLQKKFGSRKIFIVGLSITIFACFFFPNFASVTSLPMMILFLIMQSIGVRVLWLYCYIYAYGISMLDDIKNKKRREGNVVGFMSLGLKMGAAIATWLIGFVLQRTGYDGNAVVQLSSAISGIRLLVGFIPVIFISIGLYSIIKYPMRDHDIVNIEEAIKKRNEGLPYSIESFEHLM